MSRNVSDLNRGALILYRSIPDSTWASFNISMINGSLKNKPSLSLLVFFCVMGFKKKNRFLPTEHYLYVWHRYYYFLLCKTSFRHTSNLHAYKIVTNDTENIEYEYFYAPYNFNLFLLCLNTQWLYRFRSLYNFPLKGEGKDKFIIILEIYHCTQFQPELSMFVLSSICILYIIVSYICNIAFSLRIKNTFFGISNMRDEKTLARVYVIFFIWISKYIFHLVYTIHFSYGFYVYCIWLLIVFRRRTNDDDLGKSLRQNIRENHHT